MLSNGGANRVKGLYWWISTDGDDEDDDDNLEKTHVNNIFDKNIGLHIFKSKVLWICENIQIENLKETT